MFSLLKGSFSNRFTLNPKPSLLVKKRRRRLYKIRSEFYSVIKDCFPKNFLYNSDTHKPTGAGFTRFGAISRKRLSLFRLKKLLKYAFKRNFFSFSAWFSSLYGRKYSVARVKSL